MPKYRVTGIVNVYVDTEVEAADADEACERAAEELDYSTADVHGEDLEAEALESEDE